MIDYIYEKSSIKPIDSIERRIEENSKFVIKEKPKEEKRGRPRKPGRPKKEKTKIIIN